MQVFIMRHGDAELDTSLNDSMRPLTDIGYSTTVKMAQWLNKKTITIDHVLISPYLRAEQTWRVIHQTLHVPVCKKNILSELKPLGDPARVIYLLQNLENQGKNSVLIVSHLPLLGYLVSELCPYRTLPIFNTSSIVSISISKDSCDGQFEWHIDPKELKGLQ
jgi:phosphohistidine phosphatase